jgi:hypothetical protein
MQGTVCSGLGNNFNDLVGGLRCLAAVSAIQGASCQSHFFKEPLPPRHAIQCSSMSLFRGGQRSAVNHIGGNCTMFLLRATFTVSIKKKERKEKLRRQ